ncbi:hypothetical protein M758_8G162200 [Ceratodon purpureus]|nr:hypothetical protein M758_8G162200 [Ceratodon purpureus]KAG0609153.1 hypothetical protein M758_8G162200 [Ceratodon purpureus]
MANTTTVTTVCKTMAATSNGIWQGDIPIHFALPLIIIQMLIVVTITRTLAFFFKPLKQPRVIAEVVGGILLGPSALGKNTLYMTSIFPKQSIIILEVLAQLGLLFFLFMVGLELDIKQIRKTGPQAMAISAAGITVPFASGVGVSFVLHNTIAGDVKFGPFLVFMGVAMSITAFPVLARILAERKLLTTEVGQLAMSVAAVDDVMAWVLLALAVALSGNNTKPTVVAWVLLCGIAFIVVMFVLVQPVMKWVANRSSDNEPVQEIFICLTFAGVLAAGFTTDLIGIHSIFGAFLFGLIIPKEGPFAGALVEKIEDFISILFLPLYFAASGLKTNIGSIHSAQGFGLLVLVISVACVGKVCGTFLAATATKVNPRKAITLGVLMNTKGLVELIVLNIGKDRGVLNEETFAIMVLMALFTTFITTPLVMAIYKPARNPLPYNRRKLAMEDPKDDLRILSCVHGMKNVPAMINLTEGTRGIRKRALRLYILHLMQLSERTSAIMIVQRARRDGRPFFNQRNTADSRDQIVAAFETYGQLSKVTVRPMTAISNFEDMHEDICATAADKRTAMIILPFHKSQRLDGQFETTAPGYRIVNQKVLQHAPCSVAILIDRGVGGSAQVAPNNVEHKVAVFFFGGPDDREALAYGCRMAEHPGIQLHVIRFLNINIGTTSPDHVGVTVGTEISSELKPGTSPGRGYHFAIQGLDQGQERKMDEAALELIRKGKQEDSSAELKVTFEEVHVGEPFEAVLEAARTRNHDIILVGRSRRPTEFVANHLAHRHPEYSELGPFGDALVSPDVRASVLVFQQHEASLEKNSATKDSAGKASADV